jgi:transposase-like protein
VSLTGKQLQAAQLFGEGVPRAEVARRVGISPRTLDRWRDLPEFQRAQSSEMIITVGPELPPESPEDEQPDAPELDQSEAWLYSEVSTETRSYTIGRAEPKEGDEENVTYRTEVIEYEHPVVSNQRWIGSRLNPRDAEDSIVLLHFVDDPQEARRIHDVLAAGIAPYEHDAYRACAED